jgi:hypothetical protein
VSTATAILNRGLKTKELTREEEIELHFPTFEIVDEPGGQRVLVQIKVPITVSRAGLIIPEEAREAEKDNTHIAKVLKLGPTAYRERKSDDHVKALDHWPEGPWVEEGGYARIPLYGGLRFKRRHPKMPGEWVEFAIFQDHEITSRFIGDPLAERAYL